LPGRLTPFVGRRADLDRAIELLEDSSVRLLTVLGVGGVGKTALALELAGRLQDKFEHGAAFIPLAPLDSVDELLPALAAALDVQLPPSGDLQQAVLEHLASRQILLVLDTFEHLLDEAPLIDDILVAGPRVKVLVTSREKLNLEAETLYSLAGLGFPPPHDLQNMEEYDSVRLFLQKARQVRPGFSLNVSNTLAVARICRMVDGNPLGILLAASGVEHFSPAEIADQAEISLDFLARSLRDIEPRHFGLRAVFESSFKRLAEGQKAIFRRLSVFRGGFDLPAARAVAKADLPNLIGLTDKSLLSRDPETGRYELHGLLYQYAGEELKASGERERVLAAHAAYYGRFVRQHEPRMLSAAQAGALDEMQADLDNIRQAWSRVVEERDFESARLMLPGLYAFCDMRSRFYEGEAMFRQAAEGLSPHAGELPDGAWALALLSWFDMRMYFEWLESPDEIASQGRNCLEQSLSTRDAQGTAASLNLLGAIAQHRGDFRTAIQYCQEAMRAFPQLDGVYWVNMRIGLCYEADQQYDEAIQMFQTCLQRGRQTGEAVKTGWSLQNIGDTLMFQGKPAEAETYLEQALSLFHQVGTRIGVLWSTHSLSRVAWAQGKPERARELAQAAGQLAHQLHSASWIQKTDELLQQLGPEMARAASFGPRPDVESLSQREVEVLHLLKSELTGPEIARKLVVSLNTVRFHTKHIYQKLGVNNRLEAIRRAKELGM
jgi:predicted ATPase/DNA-binding CsgD family transcriptional regulator/Tfp pilus assembly protein PilF